MPAAARLGDLCSGHSCWPSRPNIQGSPDTFINGLPAHRQGDAYAVHCCHLSCHGAVLAAGSPITFVNGLQQGHIGNPVSCGSSIITGSPDTFVDP